MNETTASLKWLENPEIFQVNRIPAHSDHKFTLYGQDSVQSLNGTWKFSYSERIENRNTEMFQSEYPLETLDGIQVPGHIQLQGYGQPQYVNVMYPWDGNYDVTEPQIPMEVNPVGSYVRDVVIEKRLLEGERQYISFQGVENAFYLFVNGKFAGYSEDSFTPSEFDITELIHDGVNRIGVEVYKWSTASWLEDQDFFRFSGIFRDVYLYAVPKIHVEDLFLHTDVTDDYRNCKFCVDAKLQNFGSNQKERFDIRLSLCDKEGNVIFEEDVLKAYDDVSEQKISFSFLVKNVKLWNAENPYLYTFCLTIREDGREIEKIVQKTGMRRFELRDKLMLMNGKRIEFFGVNRHEFDCRRGRAVTEEDMLWDIRFLKQHNINAVRTSHYPNNSRWYELCDEYGIYMIDETNMETHGTWSYFGKNPLETCIPGDKKEWTGAVLDRANSMVQRDKNHPAVVIWSCGNESYGGENIYRMSQLIRELDNSRLVHYEGIFFDRRYPDTSDMESRMYSRPWDIEEYLQNSPEKPLIECEYMHSMGNSSGGIQDYVDLADKYPMFQGSFIWDYIDQALYQKMPDGTERLGYGGDFDEVPDDGNFSGDGIVFADRTASAKACEVKAVYQPFVIKPDWNGVSVRNKRLFETTEDMILNVELLRDGVSVKTWSMDICVEPQEERYFPIDIEKYRDTAGEYFVQASMNLKNDTKWAEKGFGIATGRSAAHLVEDAAKNCETNLTFSQNHVQIVFGNQNIGFHGKKADVPGNGVSGGAEYDYDFSRKHGGLVSIRHFGREILLGKPMLRFYRAATDNDKGCRYMFDSGIWQFAERWQRCVQFHMEHTEYEVKLFYTYEIPLTDGGQVLVNDKREKLSKGEDKGNHLSGIRLETNFTVTPDGRISVEIVYPGAKNVPEFPLFGMEFPLKKEFEQFSYYGVGPEENYNDRNHGGKLGIFEESVTNNYSPYLKPQTCGNRTETRWLTLTDGQHNITFRAANGQPPFQFTALHYNEIELDTAPHKEELPNPYCTYVKIMPVHMGIGGDDSWGAQVREHLRINPEKEIRYRFDISIQ